MRSVAGVTEPDLGWRTCRRAMRKSTEAVKPMKEKVGEEETQVEYLNFIAADPQIGLLEDPRTLLPVVLVVCERYEAVEGDCFALKNFERPSFRDHSNRCVSWRTGVCRGRRKQWI